MADLGTLFDATTVDPADPFVVLPAGKYKAQLVDSDMRLTKDGTGKYLWLEFEIVEGEHAGRKLWDRLNIIHPNEQTRTIAQRALSALCYATGRLQIQESSELHNIPLMLTVRVRKPQDGYDESNEIRGYARIDNGQANLPLRSPPKPTVAEKRPGYAWDRA